MQRLPAWLPWAALALSAVSIASLTLVWSTQQRIEQLEQELQRRVEYTAEVKALASTATEEVKSTGAKLGLLEARVAESLAQRGQVEELIQSMSRSRDENVVADVDASLRVAQQQATITGSVDPLINALRQADERLARYNQPRLERVRRAVIHDLERARAVSGVDVPSLAIKLDEAVRMVDELPMLSIAVTGPEPARAATRPAAPTASRPASSVAETPSWQQVWAGWSQQVWDDVRALVRVTRIEHPEAMLIDPQQRYFLRENLKLRLLNARLSLLSRQFDLAQSDLRQAQATLQRYFDRSARRVTLATELIDLVGQQCRQVIVPRPDETLAALAAAAAGR
ncbi:uroporphyrin-III C-methyltransferase [Vitreoscilla filiformis]|uniref:Uroporphyrin-III C-methyltransferase n=1 Tax=Vitreoscilla filiformis TaxID=63 RepID=A0A221KIM7_VITFI|nr:uroporphyrinogen-III C-methyltransferase [Vitreoscilla filiformis]ASM78904.1 uroporphyrin-III C-methyltransferase [Vitreoscilla filiformis]